MEWRWRSEAATALNVMMMTTKTTMKRNEMRLKTKLKMQTRLDQLLMSRAQTHPRCRRLTTIMTMLLTADNNDDDGGKGESVVVGSALIEIVR